MGALESKIAVVTGATSGIGLAIAARFIDEGAQVFITGRRKPELDAAVEQLGPNAVGVQGDVSDLADLDRLYDVVRANGKGLDVVVANAGGGAGLFTIENLTPEAFDADFGINVRGTTFTVQKSLALLNPIASVIVLGSSAASKGLPGFGTYSASKAAIRQFARVWATELAPRGVRVNALVPGPTETPGIKAIVADPAVVAEILKVQATKVPLGRLAQPEEIANAALFLATSESSFVTGSEMFVDGGEAQAML
jgi:NAD(P)-dependent dehydrogenase (short-subunit alcohol dehydrogenase family)